jgi:SOUL heme-binding protein
MLKYFFRFLHSLFLAGCSVFGIPTVEEAKYTVLEEAPPFQIRHYDPQLVAQTQDEGGYDGASNTSFQRLFDYISGKNTSGQKIAMTAPVVQERNGEKIAMTAPVLQQQDGKIWQMAFVLPANYDLNTAPVPSDPLVQLKTIPAKKSATILYSGFLSEQAIAEKTEELTAWLASKGYKAISQPRSAGFDPPWTLPFLRRNEIHIDIE